MSSDASIYRDLEKILLLFDPAREGPALALAIAARIRADNATGEIFGDARSKIIEASGMPGKREATIKRAVKRLKTLGLIEVRRQYREHGVQSKARYYFRRPWLKASGTESVPDAKCTGCSAHGTQSGPEEGTKSVPDNMMITAKSTALTPIPPEGGCSGTNNGSPRRRRRAPTLSDDDLALAHEAIEYFNANAPANAIKAKNPSENSLRKVSNRVDEIGGLDAFKKAVDAIPLWPFLNGQARGREAYQLDLTKLLSTNGNLGDVLAGLLDRSGTRDANPPATPNDRKWGWWLGPEGKYLRAIRDNAEAWRKIMTSKDAPGLEWPWWSFGPPPGHPECFVPPEIIKEFGLAEKFKPNGDAGADIQISRSTTLAKASLATHPLPAAVNQQAA